MSVRQPSADWQRAALSPKARPASNEARAAQGIKGPLAAAMAADRGRSRRLRIASFNVFAAVFFPVFYVCAAR